MSEEEAKTQNLAKEEVEVYDRQIRLWGFEAQSKYWISLFRLKESKALLVNMRAANSELARHLVFSGINICILDDSKPDTNDKLNNFLVSKASEEDTVTSQ